MYRKGRDIRKKKHFYPCPGGEMNGGRGIDFHGGYPFIFL